MKVLVTGASGFVAKNLLVHLFERAEIEVATFTKENSVTELPVLLEGVSFVFHLAGVNRPKNDIEFTEGNVDLTEALCCAIEASNKTIPIIYTSSIQVEKNTAYGASKLAAERVLLDFSKRTGARVNIFRLSNVFGKWCKPNYNSAVATFCHNIAHDLEIKVNDPSTLIRLVYVDDVVRRFIEIMDGEIMSNKYCDVVPVYDISVGELANKLRAFKQSRETLTTEPVGVGLERALHATYLSYLDPSAFSYPLLKHGDERGVFVEMLKTQNSGQFSFFTAHPGITRGGHFHHTKTEKFLVVKGEALFKFRNVLTDEFYELKTKAETPIVVETVPGWTHDITNIGDDEMIVMLWANEVFDPDKPDTYVRPT